MEQLLAILAIVAVIASGAWFQYRLSGRRAYSPLWMAFSTTSAAIVLLVSGMIGYTLSRHDRFVAGTSWAGSIIWWQVGAGAALVPLAVFFWRKGLNSTRVAP